MTRLGFLLAAAMLAAAPGFAADHQFGPRDTVSLQPDQGYIVVRTLQRPGGALRGTIKFTPILIRLLSDEEMRDVKARAEKDPEHWIENVEPNVVEPLADNPYKVVGNEAVLVTSLKPGTYVLGGMAVTNWATRSEGQMLTSLCMGTVKFEVKPGVLTDLGAVLNARDDEPTDIPELAHVVTGHSLGFPILADAVAIRPAASATPLPESLRALPIVPAEYRAVVAYPNYFGTPIGRLAPLPGVLDYDKDGQVIDLKAAP